MKDVVKFDRSTTNYQRATRIHRVNHATFYWRNQFGMRRKCKPKSPSVHGDTIVPDAKPFGIEGHKDKLAPTMLEEAKRRGILDEWTPVVRLFLSMARVIKFEGETAVNIWRDYCAGIYGGKKKRKTA